MKKVNTYGLKMTGIKTVAGESYNYGHSGEYLELFYDCATGEVWTVYQYSLGQNSWTVYHDPSIIKIGNISRKVTMQEVADMIFESVGAK